MHSCMHAFVLYVCMYVRTDVSNSELTICNMTVDVVYCKSSFPVECLDPLSDVPG